MHVASIPIGLAAIAILPRNYHDKDIQDRALHEISISDFARNLTGQNSEMQVVIPAKVGIH